MKIKKIFYLIIAVPVILHIAVYLLSIPFAKPIIEKRLRNIFGENFKIGQARVYLLTRSVHVSEPVLTIETNGKLTEIFRAKKIKAFYKITPLLMNRCVIRNLAFYSPVFNIERFADGSSNIKSFMRTIRQAGNDTHGGQGYFAGGYAFAAINPAKTEPADNGTKPRSSFQYFIKKIYIKEGKSFYADYSVNPNVKITVSDIKFYSVLDYDYANNKLISIKIKLNALALSKQPAAIIRIDGEIDPSDNEGQTFRLNANIEDFEIMDIWPYIKDYLPLTISGGRVTMESRLNCVKGVFDNSKQTVTLKALKIISWEEDFSASKTMGLSNKTIIKFVEKNKDLLAFDFFVSGNLKDLKITPGEIILKTVGETLLENVLDNIK